MKRVLVCGYYGMSNFGDDLFVDAMASLMGDVDAKVVFLCPAVTEVEAKFAYPAFLRSAYQREDRVGGLLRATFGLIWFLWCTDCVLAGGSVLSELHGTRRLQFALDRWLPKRWAALGVSIGPFSGAPARERVRHFLNHFDTILVRDQASLDETHGLSGRGLVDNAGDLAMLKSFQRHDADGDNLLVVPCSSLTLGWHEALAREIAKVVRERQDIRVDVVSLNGHPEVGDDAIAASFAHILRDSGVDVEVHWYRSLGLAATINLVRRSRWVISGRLHGGIVAYLCGKPCIAVEYHRKVSDFVSSIEVPEELRMGSEVDPIASGLRSLLATSWEPSEYGIHMSRLRAGKYNSWAGRFARTR